MTAEQWPPLRPAKWADTCATLHMWTQIVGKVRLALAPLQNHWWHVTLYVTARGLTTSAMPYNGQVVEIAFDFFDHRVIIETSQGKRAAVALMPRTVADFYEQFTAALRDFGIAPELEKR